MTHLPNGWTSAKLGDVCDILDARRVPINADERADRIGDVPYYGATGQVGWIDDYLFDEELVLLGEDGAPFLDSEKPKAYLVRGKSWVNNHAHVLRAREGMIASFLLHQLNTVDYHPFVSGTTRLKLSQAPMRLIPLVVPPLAEQRRIAAALEEHLSDLNAAVVGLKRARANADRYIISLVTGAMSGRLSNLADLPLSDWQQVSLTDVACIVSGQTPKGVEDRATLSGEIPWIKVGDMNLEGNERQMRSSRAWLSEADARSLGLHVRPVGTIIFPKRGGAIATNKKRVLSQRAVFDLNTMGLVPRDGLGDWLWWWFQSVDLGQLGDGSNVPQINHGDVAPLRVPLPPADEQARLVLILEERTALARRTRAEIDVQIARATRLRQSILRRAFEGKLVPQDLSDEPASALISRMLAMSEVTDANSPRGRVARTPRTNRRGHA